jgi:hypothetical protein
MTHVSDQRPELTFPEVEAAALTAQYRQATVILEYGSGGSTLMASDMPDKRIYTVESDRTWINKLHAWYVGHPPASMPLLHHADIGPTRKWGYPADDATFRLWPGYAQGIWDHSDFLAPDVVLVDGRFRLACLLTVALRTQKPITVLMDDYIDRPSYHEAETMLGAPQMIGRMARFDLDPGMIPTDRLRLVVDSHLRPL